MDENLKNLNSNVAAMKKSADHFYPTEFEKLPKRSIKDTYITVLSISMF